MDALFSSRAIKEALPMRARRRDPVHSSRRGASRVRHAPPLLSLAVGLLAALGVGAVALGATPVGSQFQVNTYTTSYQDVASVGVDADGGFVVVWQSDGSSDSDTSGRSVQGQRYDASGSPIGSQFQVNTYTTDWQGAPSVAVDGDGDFVVVWQSDGSAGTDISSDSVQGQRYDASGNAVGSEFQVNTYTTDWQGAPSVMRNPDGGFVVVWLGPGLQGQHYDASGNAVGSQFQFGTNWSGASPSVAVDTDGNFMVAWMAYFAFEPVGSWHVFGRRYDASGNAVGRGFQINRLVGGYPGQGAPSVAADADGNFVVVWERYVMGYPSSSWAIRGQRYDASGNLVGLEFRVAASRYTYLESPSVAADARGDFIVVWGGRERGGGYSWISGKHYYANGNPADGFGVDTDWAGVSSAAVATNADGDFVVVWQGVGSSGTDTDSGSIQGRRFIFRAPLVPSLGPPGVIGLAVLLLGIAAAGLRARLRGRA